MLKKDLSKILKLIKLYLYYYFNSRRYLLKKKKKLRDFLLANIMN